VSEEAQKKWSVHRRNKTSGKSRGGIIAECVSEYAAKTMVNDANDGSPCFRYRAVDPDGKRLSLINGEWVEQ
jgi:hypothetical protein